MGIPVAKLWSDLGCMLAYTQLPTGAAPYAIWLVLGLWQ